MTLEPGIEATTEFEVEGRLVTDVAGTLDVGVLSTPGMIAMMERTASMMVYPLLPEGRATVGFEVCVKHVAAGKDAGETTLSNYEKALKAIASAVERGPGSSDVEWISQLANAQAKFIRDVTNAWTKAARDMLK